MEQCNSAFRQLPFHKAGGSPATLQHHMRGTLLVASPRALHSAKPRTNGKQHLPGMGEARLLTRALGIAWRKTWEHTMARDWTVENAKLVEEAEGAREEHMEL